jgi:hypothetical protein
MKDPFHLVLDTTIDLEIQRFEVSRILASLYFRHPS